MARAQTDSTVRTNVRDRYRGQHNGQIQWEENAPWITPALVKAARALLGWNQGDLAERAGVGHSTVADFERGTRDTELHIRMQIVFAFARAKILFCRGKNDKKRTYVGVRLLTKY